MPNMGSRHTSQKLLPAVLLVISLTALPAVMAASAKPRASTVQFYMHDRPGDTAVRVAPAAPLNFSGGPGDFVGAMFGSLYVMDNPLTAGPEANSTVVGRAQGVYAMASRSDEFSLFMALTYAFVAGPFNGSSFSVVGLNAVARDVRELPIVGGTGAFRLARGYCLARTHASQGMDAIVRYNATILHY
uniref:Dirigent protein n=1 Tax=Anthurium amnicola TaxID=1678845 RepID=A0A1D1YIW3_9ARAE